MSGKSHQVWIDEYGVETPVAWHTCHGLLDSCEPKRCSLVLFEAPSTCMHFRCSPGQVVYQQHKLDMAKRRMRLAFPSLRENKMQAVFLFSIIWLASSHNRSSQTTTAPFPNSKSALSSGFCTRELLVSRTCTPTSRNLGSDKRKHRAVTKISGLGGRRQLQRHI